MNETLVQWTLLNNVDYLKRSLKFDIAKRVGQEISTEFGRIDFILENSMGQQLIVELETILNTNTKFDYCTKQLINYKNVQFSDHTNYCVLYAEETTKKYQTLLKDFATENSIITRTYSLQDIKKLYPKTVERLSLSFGLALPNPKNYTICYLRWLNKILKTFLVLGKKQINFREIFNPFKNSQNSPTNFNCYLRLALDFELINHVGKSFELTNEGKDYINNLNPLLLRVSNVSSIDLTNEQKRLLLKILTNGNWTVHKVNIYWFLRFIEITNGTWLPKIKEIDSNKLELANGLFGVNYKSRTMYEFLKFASNWCMELGLIEVIKDTSNYDKMFLTPLGVEINNIFSLDLQLKKTRLNLSFKYLD